MQDNMDEYGLVRKVWEGAKNPICVATTLFYFWGCASGPSIIVRTDKRNLEQLAGTPIELALASSSTSNSRAEVSVLREKSEDKLDIIGQVQNSETDQGAYSSVKVFNASTLELLAQSDTTSYGNFHLQANTFPEQILLQARLMKDRKPFSYVRTLRLSGEKDIENLVVRAVSYEGLAENNITPEQFRTFANEINFSYHNGDPRNTGLKKWDLSKLEGVEILSYNSLERDRFLEEGRDFLIAKFTKEQQQEIKDRSLDKEDIGFYFVGINLRVQIDEEETQESRKHYTVQTFNSKTRGEYQSIVPNENWIIVSPIILNGSIAGYAAANDLNKDNYEDSGTVALSTNRVGIALEEFTNLFIGLWDTKTLSPLMSVLSKTGASLPLSVLREMKGPRFADRKFYTGVVNEPTYLPREQLDDIFGMRYLDETSGERIAQRE